MILINEIDYNLKELISIVDKKIYINTILPNFDILDQNTCFERNAIRLELIHNSLIRLARIDKRFNFEILNEIKSKILEKSFYFEIELYNFNNKKFNNINAKILVLPYENRFEYYLSIYINNELKYKFLIYLGLPNCYYAAELFSKGKWANQNLFILTGTANEVSLSLNLIDNNLTFTNLTTFRLPIYFSNNLAKIAENEKIFEANNWENIKL